MRLPPLDQPVQPGHDSALVERVLAEAKELAAAEITEVVRRNGLTGYGPLYDLISDYPFREGKGLRPAICLAAARAAGGYVDQVRTSAAALELFHNAFLLHDDVEDASEFRRGTVTLLRQLGAPVAINVGDATIVLALQMLLDNTSSIGVRKALLVLAEVERMARESVEGQAIELDWIARDEFDLDDQDYVRMAHKKTCWYTVIAPLRIGLICGHDPRASFPLEEELVVMTELGHLAGVAFQICDDLLNLEADEGVYGKENAGDLWEGKRTVMLLHHLRTAEPGHREWAIELLRQPRAAKRAADVQRLLTAMRASGSLEHGRRLAVEFSRRAIEVDARSLLSVPATDDRRFLREMLGYVIERVK